MVMLKGWYITNTSCVLERKVVVSLKLVWPGREGSVTCLVEKLQPELMFLPEEELNVLLGYSQVICESRKCL